MATSDGSGDSHLTSSPFPYRARPSKLQGGDVGRSAEADVTSITFDSTSVGSRGDYERWSEECAKRREGIADHDQTVAS